MVYGVLLADDALVDDVGNVPARDVFSDVDPDTDNDSYCCQTDEEVLYRIAHFNSLGCHRD